MEFTITRYWHRGLDPTPHACHITFQHAPDNPNAIRLHRGWLRVGGALDVEPNAWIATVIVGEQPPPTRDVHLLTREQYVELGGVL